jgi:MFS family permease
MIGLGSLLVFTVFASLSRRSGVEMLFYVSALIGLVGMCTSATWLKERLQMQKEQSQGVRELVKVVRENLGLKASYLCGLVARADTAVIGTYLITWAVSLAPDYGLSSEAASFKGAVPMMVMGAFTLVAFPVFGILLDRWGRVPTMILCLVLGGTGFFLIAASPAPFLSPSTLLGVLLAGCSVCGAVVGSSALTSDVSPRGLVGATLGGLNTMAQIGLIFFLLIGGVLFDKIGPWGVFFVKGAANIVVGLYIFLIRKKIKIHPA